MPRAATFRDFDPIALAPDARVFILTGAGISAESGIRTFRGANGLWEQYRFEEVASPAGWRAHPQGGWRFYAQRRAPAAHRMPSAADAGGPGPRAGAQRGGPPVTTVYIGPEEPDNVAMFDECRLGKASEVVAGLFATP